jgi:diguanylate cyclase (GGDEF)-like protein
LLSRLSRSRFVAVLALGGALGLCWLPTRWAGGADYVPPLWPLVPILLAARRFGMVGGIVAAVLGGLITGPLTAANVAPATAQLPSDWLVRLGFFVLIAVVSASLFRSLKDEGARHRAARGESERMAARLDADVQGRKRLEGELRALAYRDQLTGLANRSLLEELLSAALARARRVSSAVALICLDVNDFKLVNDSLGHAAGDRLLCEVTRRLDEAIRAEDLLARYGGDEFLIMIPDIHADAARLSDVAVATAARLFERITAAMASPFHVANAVFHIEVSAGVSIYPRDALDADALHRHADAAMY